MEFIHEMNKWTWILSIISTILVLWPVIKKMTWARLAQWGLLLSVLIFFITLPMRSVDDSDPLTESVPVSEEYVTVKMTKENEKPTQPTAPVPEPSTFLLLAAGIGVLIFNSKNKRK